MTGMLLAPKKCSVCGLNFEAGDVIIFERKATVVSHTEKRRNWRVRPSVVEEHTVLRIHQAPSKITVAHHEGCG